MYVLPTVKSVPSCRRGVSPTSNRPPERHTKHRTDGNGTAFTHDPFQTLQLQERDEKHGTQSLPRGKLSRPKRTQLLEGGLGTRALSSDLLVTSVERLSLSTAAAPLSCRAADERTAATPDKVNLDRRQLTCCPSLEGEERLRLLNLQHNSIARLENLSRLTRLVFLDLYDNVVTEISGLDELVSLRVLMLGKNRIRRISGLECLVHLDVLDLHGNLIREMENLSHLCHLRVLNLAGNELVNADHFEGLYSLVELNLRRNKISQVCGLEVLPNLQRLFLSYNIIKRWEDILCLSNCCALSELALDGNPLSMAVGYRPALLCCVQQLSILDQKAITEEEWVIAVSTVQTGYHRVGRSSDLKEHREKSIRGIRERWNSSHYSNHDMYDLPTYLVDHDMECQTLTLYGAEALEALEWAGSSYKGVTQLHLCCMGLEDAVPYFRKVASILPDMATLVLECTNMTRLEHINALAELGVEHLPSLTISPKGNPITKHPHFLHYCLYRLQHLGLCEVNAQTVAPGDQLAAIELFGSLGDLVSSYPLVRSHGEPVSMETRGMQMALKYPRAKCTPDDDIQRAAAQFSAQVMSSALAAHLKAEEVSKLWPTLLADLVHLTMQEYRSIDEQMAALLDKL